jgi:hypothetical protein
MSTLQEKLEKALERNTFLELQNSFRDLQQKHSKKLAEVDLLKRINGDQEEYILILEEQIDKMKLLEEENARLKQCLGRLTKKAQTDADKLALIKTLSQPTPINSTKTEIAVINPLLDATKSSSIFSPSIKDIIPGKKLDYKSAVSTCATSQSATDSHLLANVSPLPTTVVDPKHDAHDALVDLFRQYILTINPRFINNNNFFTRWSNISPLSLLDVLGLDGLFNSLLKNKSLLFVIIKMIIKNFSSYVNGETKFLIIISKSENLQLVIVNDVENLVILHQETMKSIHEIKYSEDIISEFKMPIKVNHGKSKKEVPNTDGWTSVWGGGGVGGGV